MGLVINAQTTNRFTLGEVQGGGSFKHKVVELSGPTMQRLRVIGEYAYLCLYYHARAVAKAVSIPFFILSKASSEQVAMLRKECVLDYKRSVAYFKALITLGTFVEPECGEEISRESLVNAVQYLLNGADAQEGVSSFYLALNEKVALQTLLKRTDKIDRYFQKLEFSQACVLQGVYADRKMDFLENKDAADRAVGAFSYGTHTNADSSELECRFLCGEFFVGQTPLQLFSLIAPKHGTKVASHIEIHFVPFLQNALGSVRNLSEEVQVLAALEIACYQLHASYVKDALPEQRDFAELTCALIIGTDLWSISVGTAGAVIFNKERAVQAAVEVKEEGFVGGIGGCASNIIPLARVNKVSFTEIKEGYMALSTGNVLKHAGWNQATALVQEAKGNLSNIGLSLVAASMDPDMVEEEGYGCLVMDLSRRKDVSPPVIAQESALANVSLRAQRSEALRDAEEKSDSSWVREGSPGEEEESVSSSAMERLYNAAEIRNESDTHSVVSQESLMQRWESRLQSAVILDAEEDEALEVSAAMVVVGNAGVNKVEQRSTNPILGALPVVAEEPSAVLDDSSSIEALLHGLTEEELKEIEAFSDITSEQTAGTVATSEYSIVTSSQMRAVLDAELGSTVSSLEVKTQGPSTEAPLGNPSVPAHDVEDVISMISAVGSSDHSIPSLPGLSDMSYPPASEEGLP